MPLEIPSGANTVMKVSTPPTGWTKTNTFNLNVLRVVTGSASSGGSVNYTDVLKQHTVTTTSVAGSAGGVSLTAPQLPLHTHNVIGPATSAAYQVPGPGLSNILWSANPGQVSQFVGNSDSHSHSATVGSGSFAAASNIDLRVKYVDIILVQRS